MEDTFRSEKQQKKFDFYIDFVLAMNRYIEEKAVKFNKNKKYFKNKSK